MFYLGSRARTPGNGSKLHLGRVRLDKREHFLTERIAPVPGLSMFEAFGQCPTCCDVGQP